MGPLLFPLQKAAAVFKYYLYPTPQSAFTFSKLTIETPEKYVKPVQSYQ